MRSFIGFRAGDDEAYAREIVRMGDARIAREEGIGAEHDRGVRLINELWDDAIVQRRWIKINRDAGDERHQQARGQAERMEDREGVEDFVGAVAGDAREALSAIRENVPVREHDAFRRTLPSLT